MMERLGKREDELIVASNIKIDTKLEVRGHECFVYGGW